MSRTYRSERKKNIYAVENTYARRLINRVWRRQGKRLMQDAPPQKGTQGWNTW